MTELAGEGSIPSTCATLVALDLVVRHWVGNIHQCVAAQEGNMKRCVVATVATALFKTMWAASVGTVAGALSVPVRDIRIPQHLGV